MESADGSLCNGTLNEKSGRSSPIPVSRQPSPLPSSRIDSPSDGKMSFSARATSTMNGTSSRRFLGKHLRKLSTSLPSYSPFSPALTTGPLSPSTPHRGPGSWSNTFNKLRLLLLRRTRASILVLLIIGIIGVIFLEPMAKQNYRSARYLGGGHRFVIILAANKGGGVMEWKDAKQWAAERESIANKKHYTNLWGYHLTIKDLSTKKKYAHEWRESWEKVDIIKQSMRQFPKAEWFWWMDLHTYIMEPSVSLQKHIFDHLEDVVYRDINLYNPLNLTHPPPKTEFKYLTEEELSTNGDGNPQSINLIVPQDCGGFNLGSFFIRRSEWTERLLDIWWDPVAYEQNHMHWEHKEQDALEYLYTNQPWVRTATAFIPQRMINSFPQGACAETPDDPRIFYNSEDRDFVVNMAGCEWGRDCWGEMASFKRLAKKLHSQTWWNRLIGKD